MHLPLILGFDGYSLPKETTLLWKKIKPIGTILFKKNIKDKNQLRDLVQQIKDFDPEMLLTIDYEGGVVHRFSKNISVIASAKSMGRTFQWDKISQGLQVMAETLSYFGFHINLAPVLDFEGIASSPAIQNRGFYPDSQLINEYNKIFVEEHSKLGIYCVGKHFPGLYKVVQDPHKEESCFEGNRDDLDLSISCYQNLFTQKRQGVMSSHVYYKSLDEENPATFSAKIIENYLKKKMGFSGLVFSDCLEMKGIADSITPENITEKTLAAGHHMLISCYQFKKSMAFQESLARGIENYFQKNEKTATIHSEKVLSWQKQLLSNSGKTSQLPNSKEVININQSFIDRRIFKLISRIDSFVLLTTESEENEKSISKTLQKLPEFFHKQVFSLQKILEKTKLHQLKEKVKGHSLVFVLESPLTNELLEQFKNIIELAKQNLVISISFHLESNLPIGEEWILWGRNHSINASLIELFKSKCKALKL